VTTYFCSVAYVLYCVVSVTLLVNY